MSGKQQILAVSVRDRMIFTLAFKSLWFEKLVSFCIFASLCSVIAPLMFLFSLKYGIISTLEHDLKSSPLKLEIKMMTGYKLDENFINQVKNDSKVQFCLPLTRSLSATADINYKGKIKTSLSALPTAIYDPIAIASNLDGVLKENEAYLSQTLCDDLKIKTGDTFKLVISRIVDSKRQNSVVEFKLKGIIKKEYQSINTIYVNYNTMLYMEDFRDGYEPPVFSDGSNLNLERKYFAKLRLYVKTLDDVEPMAAFFRERNYQIKACINEIEELKAISSVLSVIFYSVAFISITGGILASGGLILTNLIRLEKSYALLKLDGMSEYGIMQCIIVQNLTLGLLSYLGAFTMFCALKFSFNQYFADRLSGGTLISVFNFSHVILGLLFTLLVLLIISLVLSTARIRRLNVADTLRRV